MKVAIKKLRVEVNIPSHASPSDLGDDAARFVRHILLPMIEKLLAELDKEHHGELSLASAEINLDLDAMAIDGSVFRRTQGDELRELVKQEILRNVAQQNEFTKSDSPTWAQFLFIINNGYTPWSFSEKSHNEFEAELISFLPGLVKSNLTTVSLPGLMRVGLYVNRIVYTFSVDFIYQLIQILEAEKIDSIEELEDAINIVIVNRRYKADFYRKHLALAILSYLQGSNFISDVTVELLQSALQSKIVFERVLRKVKLNVVKEFLQHVKESGLYNAGSAEPAVTDPEQQKNPVKFLPGRTDKYDRLNVSKNTSKAEDLPKEPNKETGHEDMPKPESEDKIQQESERELHAGNDEIETENILNQDVNSDIEDKDKRKHQAEELEKAKGKIKEFDAAFLKNGKRYAAGKQNGTNEKADAAGLTDKEQWKKDEIYIENAGIVLLAPFIAGFFEKLGLVSDGNLNDPSHAVYLLQALAGIKEMKEYLLPLNKIICGIAPSDIIKPFGKISRKEKREIQNLLTAVITHWSALKSTSVLTLQTTYLQRAGKIYFENDCFYLTVEKKTEDIMIDFMPWSFSIVELPWMNYMLKVDWNY